MRLKTEDESKSNGLTSANAFELIAAQLGDQDPPSRIASPIDPSRDLVQCTDCHKTVLASAAQTHAENCKKAKELSARRAALARDRTPSLKRQLSNGSTDSSPAKKMKKSFSGQSMTPGSGVGTPATSGTLVPPLLKKASTPSSTGTPGAAAPPTKPTIIKLKPRGPVDVDRQCGVINDKGLPCSRSLTCKTHSMSAKRAVPGRSLPYDVMLADWQRANRDRDAAKGVAGSSKKDAAHAGPTDGAPVEGGSGESHKKKKLSKKKGAAVQHGSEEDLASNAADDLASAIAAGLTRGPHIVGEWPDSDDSDDEGLALMLDSDEEADEVMRGLSRAPRGRPLAPSSAVSPGAGSSAGLAGTSLFLYRNYKAMRLRPVVDSVFGVNAVLGATALSASASAPAIVRPVSAAIQGGGPAQHPK